MPGKTPIFWITAGVGALLIAAYAALWLALGEGRDPLMAFWPFSGVGLAGALVANSTGVGGGVVFVPAFSMLRETGTLDISPMQTIGVSFAIQCFGMTVGSLTWLNRFYRPDIHPVEVSHRPMLWRIIVLVLPPALIALFLAQYALRLDAHLAFLLFKLFSILLGGALLIQLIISRNKGQEREELVRGEAYILAGVGLAGGLATALFSVGVGELLALYLFLRRYPVDICVSTAVVCSAVSVWAGVIHHVEAGHIVWQILIFAAPAVALGGFLARRLAHALGAFRLKFATAIWILTSSLALLFLV